MPITPHFALSNIVTPEESTQVDSSSALTQHPPTLDRDTFSLVMQQLSAFERCSARSVSKNWNQFITQGAGVPAILRVPSQSTGRLRGLLSSQEVAHAQFIDASTMAIRASDYLHDPLADNGSSRSYGLTDQDLNWLTASTKVKAVDLRVNPGLRGAAVQIVANRFPNIEYLCLYACSDAILEGLPVLAEKAINLKSIMLTHSSQNACFKICDFLKVGGARLESIYIGGIPGHQLFRQLLGRVPNVEGRAVLNDLPHVIATSCRNVKRLGLPWYANLTEEQLQTILENCPDITHLHISTGLLRASFIEKVLKECPGLQKVTLNIFNASSDWDKLAEMNKKILCEQSAAPWWKEELMRVKETIMHI